MADTINTDGNPTPQGKTVEQLQAEIDALKSKADKSEYFKSEMEKVISQRDKLKGDLKAKEDAEAIKNGDLQKLLDAEKAEKEALKLQAEKDKADAEEYRTFKETKRNELIAKLSDEDKEIASEIKSLTKLEKFVAKQLKQPPISTDDGVTKQTITDDKELTPDEKKEANEMFAGSQDPIKEYKLFKQSRKKKE